MSDETELNPQLRETEAAIEASLRGVMLPDSAIDHDQVMYQAGWAAALAERDELNASVQNKRNTGYWPALAMTFAATTAACLMVILMPSAENGSVAANNKEPDRPETVVKIDQADQGNANDIVHASQTKTKPTSSTDVPAQRFGMARLLGSFAQRITADRNALFEKHLAETASPSLAVFQTPNDDQDFERREPLTARSVISLSL